MSRVEEEPLHIALLPSGLGPLTPFFRLAAMLTSRRCKVTFITIQPMVARSNLISTFYSNHPEINFLEFDIILPFNTSSFTTNDPFIIQFEGINRSIHLLGPLLSSLPKQPSAIFSDFALSCGLSQITANIGIPHYIVSNTSARFYATVGYLPVLISENLSKFSDSSAAVEIPGLDPLQVSSLPPTWLDDSPMNYILKDYLIPNAESLPKIKGVLINTFNWLEQETIVALKNNRDFRTLPTVFPVGPWESQKLMKCNTIQWLDSQCSESVVYVNFGNREPISTDQIRELGNGLVKSEYPFLWILKGDKIEKDNNDEEFRDLFGNIFLEKTKNEGRIIKGWVNQEEILAHPSIGGFVNQCEWESVMDAAKQGVPILAWPQHGDQKMNAVVVEKAGLGIWAKEWGWGWERLVKGEEIEKMVREMMKDLNLRCTAKKVGEEARKACEIGGSSEKELMWLIEMLKNGN